jgi:hypothetical protein
VNDFQRDGFVFRIDSTGEPLGPEATELPRAATKAFAAALAPGDETGDLHAFVEERLGDLTGADIADDEGMFELLALDGQRTVAALILSVEDNEVELSGFVVPGVDVRALGAALGAALFAPT